jgi:hypothetical protein
MKVIVLAAAVASFASAAAAYGCGSARTTSAQTPIITAPATGT